MLESKLVRDLNGLYQKKIVAALRGRASGTTTTTFAVGYDGTKLAGGFLLIALHWLASRHARCHQCTELHHLRAREFEGVEVREEDLK